MAADDHKQIRVGVADKSPLIRAALKHLFSEDERFELLDVCSDGEGFLQTLERVTLDVGVIGWVIAPGDCKYVLDHLQSRTNVPRIVVYTGTEDADIPSLVMAHGGAGFVSKREEPQILLDAVADVGAGRMVFPFLDVRKIHQNPLTSLTKRELEVLAFIAEGKTNKQIAKSHGVSPNTVKFHVRNVLKKLGVNNRSHAVALYLKS